MDSLKAEAASGLASGNLQIAYEKYQCALVLAKTPHDKGALESNLSLVELKRGNIAMGKMRAQNTIVHRPEWEKGYFRLGECLFEENDFKEAKQQYEIAMDKASDDSSKQRLKHRIRLSDEGLTDEAWYFRQLQPGRDICQNAKNFIEQQVFSAAKSMRNYIYVVGDAKTRECMVIDACWDVDGILEILENEKMKLVAAACTHYHFDHVGGDPPAPFNALGIKVPGLASILEKCPDIKAHIPVEDAAKILADNPSIKDVRVQKYADGDIQTIGRKKCKWVHTPGHSPGSSILSFTGKSEEGTGKGAGILLSGDTIFPGSCGRLDMPDGNVDRMYETMRKCRTQFDKNSIIYPGHSYSGAYSSIGREIFSGMLREMSLAEWRQMHAC